MSKIIRKFLVCSVILIVSLPAVEIFAKDGLPEVEEPKAPQTTKMKEPKTPKITDAKTEAKIEAMKKFKKDREKGFRLYPTLDLRDIIGRAKEKMKELMPRWIKKIEEEEEKKAKEYQEIYSKLEDSGKWCIKTDKDEQDQYKVKGDIYYVKLNPNTGKNEIVHDYDRCKGGKILIEFTCENYSGPPPDNFSVPVFTAKVMEVPPHTCIGNEMCIDGACVPSECYDSDKGDDFFTAGTVQEFNDDGTGKGPAIPDQCQGNILMEGVCTKGEDGKLKFSVIAKDCCLEGKVCQDGACVTLIPGTVGCCQCGIVNFVDSKLEKLILWKMGKAQDDKIACEEAMDISKLALPSDSGISDLSGIECFTNLTELLLGENQISDIGPLSGLTNLTYLGLRENQIINIESLAELTNLTKLSLRANLITEIEPLVGLTNLKTLFLGENQISNIGPLSGLTNLKMLSLGQSQISDIGPLSGLTNLKDLLLDYNQIINIEPLVGLNNLVWLALSHNQVSNIGPLSGLTKLVNLGLNNNEIIDVGPLSGLTNLTNLHLSSNQISNIFPLVQNIGLGAGDTVTLYGNPLSPKSEGEYILILEGKGVVID